MAVQLCRSGSGATNQVLAAAAPILSALTSTRGGSTAWTRGAATEATTATNLSVNPRAAPKDRRLAYSPSDFVDKSGPASTWRQTFLQHMLRYHYLTGHKYGPCPDTGKQGAEALAASMRLLVAARSKTPVPEAAVGGFFPSAEVNEADDIAVTYLDKLMQTAAVNHVETLMSKGSNSDMRLRAHQIATGFREEAASATTSSNSAPGRRQQTAFGYLASAEFVLAEIMDLVNKQGGAAYKRIVPQILKDAKADPLVKGIRINVKGPLKRRAGEMAALAWSSHGPLPLSTMSEKIDFAQGHVNTRLGTIGIKVFIAY